jgi:hypothetical protein
VLFGGYINMDVLYEEQMKEMERSHKEFTAEIVADALRINNGDLSPFNIIYSRMVDREYYSTLNEYTFFGAIMAMVRDSHVIKEKYRWYNYIVDYTKWWLGINRTSCDIYCFTMAYIKKITLSECDKSRFGFERIPGVGHEMTFDIQDLEVIVGAFRKLLRTCPLEYPSKVLSILSLITNEDERYSSHILDKYGRRDRYESFALTMKMIDNMPETNQTVKSVKKFLRVMIAELQPKIIVTESIKWPS